MSTSEDVTNHCSNNPARGAPNGLLLAKNLEKGMMPSWPRACTTGWATISLGRVGARNCRYVPRPWVYCTDMMLAHVETATRPATIYVTGQAVSYAGAVGRLTLSAPMPHSLPKNSAATIRPLPSISSLGTTAK